MTRLLSGVALAAAALAAILFLPDLGLRVLACLVAAAAAREYVQILHSHYPGPGGAPVLLLVALTCWVMFSPSREGLLVLVLLGVAWVAVEVLFRGLAVDRAAARSFAIWYIGMPLGMLTAVHARGGEMATLLLIATIVVSDSGQYYSGRMFGRYALAPAISPKKTVEGAVGGLILATAFVVVAGSWVFPLAAPLSLALLGVAVVALGICGDLFESRLKRTAGVKDSSALIPGHGGLLDRIDALLFATPAFYLYLQG